MLTFLKLVNNWREAPVAASAQSESLEKWVVVYCASENVGFARNMKFEFCDEFLAEAATSASR